MNPPRVIVTGLGAVRGLGSASTGSVRQLSPVAPASVRLGGLAGLRGGGVPRRARPLRRLGYVGSLRPA